MMLPLDDCSHSVKLGMTIGMTAKKRLLWLDMAKGLAILTVVLGHCMSDTTGLHDIIYSFHMPLFFALAGYTMRPKPRKDVALGSARRLLVPYFAVCAILLAFAFVPPSSINSNLDTQRPVPVVLVEILYASGQEGVVAGHTYQAIGALWFLPCLFWGRLIVNEVLLRTEGLAGAARIVQPALILAVTALGFAIGSQVRLPFDVDTAFVAVFFMYVGYLAKRLDISRLRDVWWVVIIAVWACYSLAGNNEMATRAYLENPWSMITATAGSLTMMKVCMQLEHLGSAHGALLPLRRALSAVNRGFAWMGVSSLTILCVHRIESAIFNWQKIMEFFAPGVWGWPVAYQGIYEFLLRYALILICAIVVVNAAKAIHSRRAAS